MKKIIIVFLFVAHILNTNCFSHQKIKLCEANDSLNEYKIGWLNPEILIINKLSNNYSWKFNLELNSLKTCIDTLEKTREKVAATNIHHKCNVTFNKYDKHIIINNHKIITKSMILKYHINPNNNNIVAIATYDNRILIYNYKQNQLLLEFKLNTNQTLHIKWNTNGQHLAIISSNVQMFYWTQYELNIISFPNKIKTRTKLNEKSNQTHNCFKWEKTVKSFAQKTYEKIKKRWMIVSATAFALTMGFLFKVS